eukprot:6523205-Pyramimonas_sp.AAC.1
MRVLGERAWRSSFSSSRFLAIANTRTPPQQFAYGRALSALKLLPRPGRLRATGGRCMARPTTFVDSSRTRGAHAARPIFNSV